MQNAIDGMKVLVAEDSDLMRRLLVTHLRNWGYDVIEAVNGEQAWAAFQAEPISMVLTDWIMPEVDGLELIRRIRATPSGPYCYSILLTAKSETEDLVHAMEAGADDFLVKPCDGEELRVRLREGERIIRLQFELAEQNRQLRETQAALVQSEKLASLGQLAAGMAHEINNPIAFVTNNLAVMKRDLTGLMDLVNKYRETRPYLDNAPEKLVQEIDELEQECDCQWLQEYLPKLLASSSQGLTRVRDIISNLRDFARLDQAAYGTLDLSQSARNAADMLSNLLAEKDVSIHFSRDQPLSIACHGDKIQQVIFNTLLNAVQASAHGAVIDVILEEDGEFASLRVNDHGEGMDRETLDRVFEPFFTTKPVGTGTGLGMAVSYGIVRDHGGTITIQSSPGSGTEVNIRLPLNT
ncbi:sensor histidine kinase [Stieleria varia]|uniref:histidine kinase n=1 Tax=Stieleria varia TaxID=2528005 RepID=A0A5C6A3Q0_9BACT|nr:response regulator [Stieleria varia]TWT93888.1 Sensor protein ZraS [Stieleria varia]